MLSHCQLYRLSLQVDDSSMLVVHRICDASSYNNSDCLSTFDSLPESTVSRKKRKKYNFSATSNYAKSCVVFPRTERKCAFKGKKELSLFIKGKVKMIVQLFDNDYYELSPLFSAIKRHKLDCRDNKHLYGVRNH